MNRNIYHHKVKEAKNKTEELSFKNHKLTLDLEYSNGKYLDLAMRFVSLMVV